MRVPPSVQARSNGEPGQRCVVGSIAASLVALVVQAGSERTHVASSTVVRPVGARRSVVQRSSPLRAEEEAGWTERARRQITCADEATAKVWDKAQREKMSAQEE